MNDLGMLEQKDKKPEARNIQKNHKNVCDLLQSHKTEISSIQQKREGILRIEPECHNQVMEKRQSTSECSP